MGCGAEGDDERNNVSYGFHVDAVRCIGCRACVDACCAQCRVPDELSCRTVTSYEGGVWEEAPDGTCSLTLFAYFISVSCLHCARPACMAVCTEEALRRQPGTGLMRVVSALCTGCGDCAQACPYGVVKIDPRHGVAVICDACAAVIEAGRQPACVEACPEDALHFGEIGDLQAAYGELASIPPLPPADATYPSLVLTAPPALLSALR